jgi:hypothetical protein
MRMLRIAGLAIAAALAAQEARSLTLHLHIEGSIIGVYDEYEFFDEVGLGILPGAPVTLDVVYDLDGADSYSTQYWNSETVVYELPSAAFSATLEAGATTYSSAPLPSWDAGVSTYHTVGLASPLQDYLIGSPMSAGAGCALSCGVLNLLLRDELAPFELFEGKSLFQVPEVSAVSLFAGWVHDPEQAYWQFAFSADSIAFEVVPEPKASLLLGLGLAAVGWRRRRAGPPA